MENYKAIARYDTAHLPFNLIKGEHYSVQQREFGGFIVQGKFRKADGEIREMSNLVFNDSEVHQHLPQPVQSKFEQRKQNLHQAIVDHGKRLAEELAYKEKFAKGTPQRRIQAMVCDKLRAKLAGLQEAYDIVFTTQ